MPLLTIHHKTEYRYTHPVAFGEHRIMLRPRDSHDLRLVDAELTLSPPGQMRWMHDVFGNSVAQAVGQPENELVLGSGGWERHFRGMISFRYHRNDM